METLNTYDKVNKDDIINIVMAYEKSKGTNMGKNPVEVAEFEDSIKLSKIAKHLWELKFLGDMLSTYDKVKTKSN